MIESEIRKKIAEAISGNLPTELAGATVQEEVTEYRQEGLELSIFVSTTEIQNNDVNRINTITYDIAISSTGRDGVGEKAAQTKLESMISFLRNEFLKYWNTLGVTKRLTMTRIVFSASDDVDAGKYARIAHVTLLAEVWEAYA